MRTVKAILILSTLAFGASAAPVFTLDPANGAVSTTPGGTTGWGFTFTSDSDQWISFTGSFLLGESTPDLGVYTDFIGGNGGPAGGVLPAGVPVWSQPFSALNLTGVGSYTIDPFAPAGAVNSGTLRILYEIYSDDPYTCGACFAGSSYFDVPVSIEVSDVPEPGTLSVAVLAIIGGALCRRAARLRRTS